MKKQTLEEVQKNIDKVQNGRIKIIGHFVNTHTKALIKCVECGLEWETTPHSLTRKPVGLGCRHHVNMTTQMVKKRIAHFTNGAVTMLGKYKGAKVKTKMLCNRCGNEWSTQPYVVYTGHKCPYCSNLSQWNTERFKRIVKEKTGDEYLVLGKVKNGHTPVLMKHNISTCGRVFKMDPNSFTSCNHRCKDCAYKKLSIKQSTPIDIAKERMYKARKGEFEIYSEYYNLTKKCFIKHSKGCGKIFYAEPCRIISHASGCPLCYCSYGEEATRNYLKLNNFVFKEQYKIELCRNIRPLPFDFAVFNSKNKLSFLIEYQGIQHYKDKFGKDNFLKTKLRDKIKYDYCKENNIKLIRIPYKRWRNFKSLQKQVNLYLNKEISKLISNQAV